MTHSGNNQTDQAVQQVRDALREFCKSHPDAQIDVRRQNPVAIRIRIIDPDFAGMDRVDREPDVWDLLKSLPEDVFTHITMVLLLTPEEAESSLANLEFDDPIPSRM